MEVEAEQVGQGRLITHGELDPSGLNQLVPDKLLLLLLGFKFIIASMFIVESKLCLDQADQRISGSVQSLDSTEHGIKSKY